MSTVSELVAGLRQDLAGVRSRVIGITENDILYSLIGESVLYGCKVTGSTASPQDNVVNLEGQASGDSANLNPDLSLTPTIGYEYPNIACTKGKAFRTLDLTATVETAPATGTARYDIAYIYVGQSGAGFGIASGTPHADVKTDFDSNGLDTAAYGAATITDPALPAGAMPVARIYVEDVYTGIQSARIADLRQTNGVVGYCQAAQAAAEAAQALAEAALDSFDDKYLGAKSSEPTLDNDGNALQSGALFFDTTAGAMKVWDISVSPNAWRSDTLLAQAAASSASTSASNAATSETNAGTSETNAAASASAASTSETNAGTSETNAAASAAAAATSESNAATSEGDANSWMLNAYNYAVQADLFQQASEEWANNAEDVPVSVSGSPQQFSSRHHSAKAAASAAAAATSESNAGTSETNAAASEAAAEEWANNAEDVPVSVSGSPQQFSAKHHAAKAAAYLATAQDDITTLSLLTWLGV